MGQITLETLVLSYQGESYYPSRSTHDEYESTTGGGNVKAAYLHGRRWLNASVGEKSVSTPFVLLNFKSLGQRFSLLCLMLSQLYFGERRAGFYLVRPSSKRQMVHDAPKIQLLIETLHCFLIDVLTFH